MGMSMRLSLQNRFLIAPFIGGFLAIALYLSSNAIILSHSDLFQQLSRQNLSKSHSQLMSLLLTAVESANEEQVYLQGKKMLNGLHALEKQFDLDFSFEQEIIINSQNIGSQIRQAFTYYKKTAIGAIELSGVDSKLAKKKLLILDVALKIYRLDQIRLTTHSTIIISPRRWLPYLLSLCYYRQCIFPGVFHPILNSLIRP